MVVCSNLVWDFFPLIISSSVATRANYICMICTSVHVHKYICNQYVFKPCLNHGRNLFIT